jgi:hypothetical protein
MGVLACILRLDMMLFRVFDPELFLYASRIREHTLSLDFSKGLQDREQGFQPSGKALFLRGACSACRGAAPACHPGILS